jgi:hypothetical protein
VECRREVTNDEREMETPEWPQEKYNRCDFVVEGTRYERSGSRQINQQRKPKLKRDGTALPNATQKCPQAFVGLQASVVLVCTLVGSLDLKSVVGPGGLVQFLTLEYSAQGLLLTLRTILAPLMFYVFV